MSLPPVPAGHVRRAWMRWAIPLDRMLPFTFLAFDSYRQTEIR